MDVPFLLFSCFVAVTLYLNFFMSFEIKRPSSGFLLKAQGSFVKGTLGTTHYRTFGTKNGSDSTVVLIHGLLLDSRFAK